MSARRAVNALDFDGRVALVTGAGRGLGRAHALALARRGARVVVNDLAGDDGDPAAEVVAAIRAEGGEAVADGGSVADTDPAEGMVARALRAFGRLDVVVNNAGILRDASLAKTDDDAFDLVLAVHLGGTFRVTRAAWPHLKAQGFGRIVNTTSVAGYLGNFGQANYSAAKAGIIGLTRTTAIEGARSGITANAVAPGARTRMTEDLLGDLAGELDPERVSEVVAWLAHDSCDVTGEVISVGGRRVARVLTAQTVGLVRPALSAEDIRDHWADVIGTAQVEPRTAAEELALMLDRPLG